MTPKTPAVRKRLSPSRRREQIIESARTVFSQTGASRTKVKNIAREAGITEPLLYSHFDSRDELFRAAVLDPLDAIVANLADELHALAGEPLTDRPALHLRLHRAFLGHVIHLIPLMAAAQFADPVEGPRFYAERVLPKVRDNVLGLMSAFTGLAPRSIEMDVAVRALIGVHLGIALETVLGGDPLDADAAARDLVRMFGTGLAHAGNGRLGPRGRVPAQARPVPAPLPVESTGVRKRLSRSDRTDAIKAAAREVFLRHGLAGARSRQIAERSGITEAFMFRIFDSKEQMYDAAILDPLAAAFDDFAHGVRALAREHSGLAFLHAFNHVALPFFMENGPLCIVALFSELEQGQKYYRRVLAPHLKSIRTTLSRQAGLIDPAVDAETARRAIFGAHWGVSFDHQHRAYAVHSDGIVSILTRLFTVGVGPDSRFF